MDGKFYGTTSEGGTYRARYDLQDRLRGRIRPLHTFRYLPHPRAALVQASDGTFYGSTEVLGNKAPSPRPASAGHPSPAVPPPGGLLLEVQWIKWISALWAAGRAGEGKGVREPRLTHASAVG
jgi:hypothetical protein